MTWTVKDIEEISSDCLLKGNFNGFFSNFKPIFDADNMSLSWIAAGREDSEELLQNTKANVIVCAHELNISEQGSEKTFIQCENPRAKFAEIIRFLAPKNKPEGIHKMSDIHPEAKIGEGCYVGAFCSIGKAVIGENCQLHSNVTIYDNVIIGDNVEIYSGAVIGSSGFGYARNDKEELEEVPHIGGVVIKSNVRIGAQTTVNRAALTDTIVGEGTKIDDHVHVGHNVKLGKHCLITAHTMLGGSEYGDYIWIGPNSTVGESLKIGERSYLGFSSVVTKDVPAGQIWAGSPAREIEKVKKERQIMKKLLDEN